MYPTRLPEILKNILSCRESPNSVFRPFHTIFGKGKKRDEGLSSLDLDGQNEDNERLRYGVIKVETVKWTDNVAKRIHKLL